MYQAEFTNKEIEAIKHIRNYLFHKGRTPSIRELMRLLKSKSIKSTQDILFVLNEKGIIQKLGDGTYKLILDPNFGPSRAQTLNIPVVGVVACGSPIFAEQNIEGYIPISTAIAKTGHRYFLLHAKGDSMNEAGINDGDLVLIKQQNTAQEGEYVVALIDDEATIKEFHKMNDVVILRPKSTNPIHKSIILEEDFQIQGIVEKVIPDIG
jgi:repressor LexA